MKRIMTLLLVMALLLAGCGKEEPAAEAAPSTEPTSAPTTEAVPPTEAPTEATEAPTEESDEPDVIRHPLTGEVLEEAFTGSVTSVSVNNIKECMPQAGISYADICYEIETESDITRLLALFTDLNGIEKLGPVRSARTYFNAISYAYDATFVHCGAGHPARSGYMDNSITQIKDWHHIDANAMGKYFYRDQDRINQGIAYEHTLFTTGEKLLSALESKGYNKANEEGADFGLRFTEAPAIEGETANTLTVTFRGKKTTNFTYNADTGLYAAGQYGTDHIDSITGEAVTYRNVISLYTTHSKVKVGKTLRSFYELTGSGSGHLAVDGKIIPILWSHPSYEDPFTYTLEDGTPLKLGVGRTYIAITGGPETTYK